MPFNAPNANADAPNADASVAVVSPKPAEPLTIRGARSEAEFIRLAEAKIKRKGYTRNTFNLVKNFAIEFAKGGESLARDFYKENEATLPWANWDAAILPLEKGVSRLQGGIAVVHDTLYWYIEPNHHDADDNRRQIIPIEEYYSTFANVYNTDVRFAVARMKNLTYATVKIMQRDILPQRYYLNATLLELLLPPKKSQPAQRKPCFTATTLSQQQSTATQPSSMVHFNRRVELILPTTRNAPHGIYSFEGANVTINNGTINNQYFEGGTNNSHSRGTNTDNKLDKLIDMVEEIMDLEKDTNKNVRNMDENIASSVKKQLKASTQLRDLEGVRTGNLFGARVRLGRSDSFDERMGGGQEPILGEEINEDEYANQLVGQNPPDSPDVGGKEESPSIVDKEESPSIADYASCIIS